jgi:hypothetical protein
LGFFWVLVLQFFTSLKLISPRSVVPRNLIPGYSLADEAVAFAGAITLLIAERLDALDKRVQSLEDKTNDERR